MSVTMEFVPEPAFPEAEFRVRLARLEERIAGSDFDALLIHTPENITYVSGWHTPGYYYPQFVLVSPGADPIIVLRGLEALGLPVRSWFRADQLITFSDTDDPLEGLLEAVRRLELSGRAIGIEKTGWFLSIDFYERLRARLPSARFADGSGLVESMRKVKSPAEIERIREACRLAEAGIQAAIDHFTPGVTEAALAGQVHRAMVEEGCEYTGLPVFLMSGHRQLAPHSVWSRDKRIAPGENVFVEVAGTVNRYAGALFRTLVAGAPTRRNEENMAVAEAMLEAAMEAIRPGTTSHEVNSAVGRVADRNGVVIRKRCGYSLGLNYAPDWGEGAFLSLADGDPTALEPGMVFHLPQAVRRPGEPLVATSETVLVTGAGCEPLTHFRTGLIQV